MGATIQSTDVPHCRAERKGQEKVSPSSAELDPQMPAAYQRWGEGLGNSPRPLVLAL